MPTAWAGGSGSDNVHCLRTATTDTLWGFFTTQQKDFLSTKINICSSTASLTFYYNADKFNFYLEGKLYSTYSVPSKTSISPTTEILEHDHLFQQNFYLPITNKNHVEIWATELKIETLT